MKYMSEVKMTIYRNKKRIVARGITFINNKVLLIERNRLENGKMLHYFTVPGGGVEENETCEEACLREIKEETCVEAKIISFLKTEDYGSGICYWYYTQYISGNPTLGGEEKERNCNDNHYKIVLIDIDDIDNLFIYGLGKKLIKEAYKKELEKH